MHRATTYVSRTLAVVTVALLSFASGSASAQSLPVQPQPPVEPSAPPPAPPKTATGDGPPVLRGWHDGDPVPAGYHPARRVHEKLVLAGAATLVGSYSLLLYTAVNGDKGDKALLVPVVGPFVEAGRYGMPHGDGSTLSAFVTGLYVVYEGVLVLDGIAQAAGIVMLALGLTVPTTVLVRNDLGVIKSIRPVPMASNTMGGLGIAAQF